MAQFAMTLPLLQGYPCTRDTLEIMEIKAFALLCCTGTKRHVIVSKMFAAVLSSSVFALGASLLQNAHYAIIPISFFVIVQHSISRASKDKMNTCRC
jgi:pheromone shutdown protein TraB